MNTDEKLILCYEIVMLQARLIRFSILFYYFKPWFTLQGTFLFAI